MSDFLAELFDQFDQEEQARIRAAEATANRLIAQGDTAIRVGPRIAGSPDNGKWLLQPQDDGRVGAAGVIFIAFVNALWRKTDPARSDSINEFLAKTHKLINPVLTKYQHWEDQDTIADLRAECEKGALLVHARLLAGAGGATPPATESSAGSPQTETLHADGPIDENTSEPERKRDFRRTADLNASYARFLAG